MRELYRAQAKAIMEKQGNYKSKWMKGNWRHLTKAYPTNWYTGEKMNSYFHGKKRQHKGTDCERHLFTYATLIYKENE